MQRDGVIVLGMHRSGTSAVTAVLNAMGLHVGAPEELTATSWENPHGFFERRDLRAICDTLLWGADADWWRVSGFSLDAIPADIRAENEERIATLKAHLDAHGPWVIKEPRLCLLLPVFEAFMQRAVIVQPVRHPLEVARSLARRNGIPLCAGIALWERYNRAAAAFSRDCPRVTVDYARLVTAPGAECSRIAEHLHTAGMGPLDVDAAIARIEPDLHRERVGQGLETDFVGQPQAALWRAVVANDMAPIEPECSATVCEALCAYERDVARVREAGATIRDLRSRESTRASDTGVDRSAGFEAMRAELERERAYSNALRASRSWRLTAPLRVCGGWLRRVRRG